MNETKRSPASAATLTGAMEPGAACEGASNSGFQYNTIPANWQDGIVSSLLSAGQANAIPLRHLKPLLSGWTGREIRREIEAERRRGIPVLADCIGGYFLPASDAELEKFVNSMYSRAMEIAKTAAAVEAAAVRK